MARALHFVWLGDRLPVVEYLRSTVARQYPGWCVHVWTGPPNTWPDKWADAYERAPDHARRADILRLWALSIEGGIYYDSDFFGRAPLPEEYRALPFSTAFLPHACGDSRICYRGTLGSAANGLIVATPDSPELAELVALVLAADPTHWTAYGATPLARVWGHHKFPLVPPGMLFPGWQDRHAPGASRRAWMHATTEPPEPGECATHLWLRGDRYGQAQRWFEQTELARLTLAG